MSLKKYENLDSKEINLKIIELKKELVLINIKKNTKQNIKVHLIKKTKKHISHLLMLEKQNNTNK